jgi:hypothetical protein
MKTLSQLKIGLSMSPEQREELIEVLIDEVKEHQKRCFIFGFLCALASLYGDLYHPISWVAICVLGALYIASANMIELHKKMILDLKKDRNNW